MFEAVFSCCVHTGFSVGILAGDTLQWTGSGTTKLNIINDMIYAHKIIHQVGYKVAVYEVLVTMFGGRCSTTFWL